MASENGLIIFNQDQFKEPMIRILGDMFHVWQDTPRGRDGYRHLCIESFYRPFLATGGLDQLLFLPDWEESTGARMKMCLARRDYWARDMARQHRILAEFYPTDWYEEALERFNRQQKNGGEQLILFS